VINTKILEEENQFLKDRIKVMESKISTLSENLDISRASRVKLLDEAQQMNDQNLAVLQKHSALIGALNQKTHKISSLIEENIILKNKSMRDDKEISELRNSYRLAIQKIDEENKNLLEMNENLTNSYNEIERLKVLYQTALHELYSLTHYTERPFPFHSEL